MAHEATVIPKRSDPPDDEDNWGLGPSRWAASMARKLINESIRDHTYNIAPEHREAIREAFVRVLNSEGASLRDKRMAADSLAALDKLDRETMHRNIIHLTNMAASEPSEREAELVHAPLQITVEAPPASHEVPDAKAG